MSLSIEQIAHKVRSLEAHYFQRDSRMADITSVRRGNMEAVYPDMFPDDMPKPMVANFVDVAARDLAEVTAPLPSFNCPTMNVNSDKAKRFADKRTLIANHYVTCSGLQTQMYSAADWYLTYGFMPVVVEPNFDKRIPYIRTENPMGSYPEIDKYGRCISYTKKYMKTIRELVNDFPEYRNAIVGKTTTWEETDLDATLELVRYEDDEQIVLYLPKRGNLPLRQTPNPMGKLTVVIARRPGIDLDDPRGQFDDVMFAQIARARFSLLAMEAAEKSVQAPMVLPNDVSDFAFGPDAVIRTNNPQSVRRVGLELPTAAFTEQQVLEQEMRMGARYPEGRSGNMNASIITGQGVQALLGGFDSQVKAAQQIFADVFEEVISLCFEMDEKLFNETKNMSGSYKGAPYDVTYTPEKDIAGDYSVQVRYGLMAGLDPSRALIFSLQALQAGLISREFVMSELPWSMNVGAENDRIDVEKMRDSLAASLTAMTQAIPQMATQGQDPSEIVGKIASVIDLRKKGKTIEDSVLEVFQPPPAPEAPEAPPEAAMPPAGPELPPGAQMPPGAAPAPEGGAMPAGGPAPDVASILARLSGGQ